MYFKKIINTTVGFLLITANNSALVSIEFINKNTSIKERTNKIIDKTITQLYEYFEGTRKTFSIPIELKGTKFQEQVWTELQNITYGKTASYSDIAIAIKNPKAVRAIGNANNKNILPIIIPCHRVIGKNGKLVGYAGGLNIKIALLKLENATIVY